MLSDLEFAMYDDKYYAEAVKQIRSTHAAMRPQGSSTTLLNRSASQTKTKAVTAIPKPKPSWY